MTTTPDGSPLPVYLAAPPGDTARVALEAVPPPATVLELGAGAGRETRPLLGCGYEVTAVDESAEMLAHVTGARTVQADLFSLDLGERFGLVIGGSHFVDDADPERRAALYATCAQHVAADGVVLLERYDPTWVADAATYDGTAGPVHITFEVLDRDPAGTSARLVYDLAGRTWQQEFRFVAATTELVDGEARRHGLAVAGVRGEDRTWLELRPVST